MARRSGRHRASAPEVTADRARDRDHRGLGHAHVDGAVGAEHGDRRDARAAAELDPTVLDGTVPRGTMASPEEIAAVVVAVAGPDFGFVTGEVITADGGGSLGWLRSGGRREGD